MIFFFLHFFTKYSIHHPLSADISFKFLALNTFRDTAFTNAIPCFSKDHNCTRGDHSEKNIVWYFSLRNPYMKFQDDILMPPPPALTHARTHVRTHARTHARTHTHTHTHTHTRARTIRNQYAPHFFKVVGIKSGDIIFTIISLCVYFLDVQGQITQKFGGPIWPKFKLLLDILHNLDTYNFKIDQINSNREKVATSFLDA